MKKVELLITLLITIMSLFTFNIVYASAPNVAVLMAGARQSTKDKNELNELKSKQQLIVNAMQGSMIPEGKTAQVANDYILDNKIDISFSTTDLINIGKLLNADYIVYSQFYIDKINAPGLFHTTMKFKGQTVLTIIDVHSGEYKYKISEDVNNGKLEDVSRSMFIVYDKSIADIKSKCLKF